SPPGSASIPPGVARPMRSPKPVPEHIPLTARRSSPSSPERRRTMLKKMRTGLVIAGIGALLSGGVGLEGARAAGLPILLHPTPPVSIPTIVVVIPTGDLRGGPLHENGGHDVDVNRSTH